MQSKLWQKLNPATAGLKLNGNIQMPETKLIPGAKITKTQHGITIAARKKNGTGYEQATPVPTKSDFQLFKTTKTKDA